MLTPHSLGTSAVAKPQIVGEKFKMAHLKRIQANNRKIQFEHEWRK